MRWFLDTEFADTGRTIELISIALVPEDETRGAEFYAEDSEFDWSVHGTAWLLEHVKPNLQGGLYRRSRMDLSHILLQAVHLAARPDDKPEFWGYFPAYDWVALCQLYGPMVYLPRPLPHRCNDLAQLMKATGVTKADLPPMPTTHNALDDARWNRAVYRYISDNHFGP